MYKEIGGMNTDESTAFLEWFWQNEEYTHFHNELNLGNKRISLKHLFGIDRNVLTKQEDFPDFLETLEKTIDTYGFSI